MFLWNGSYILPHHHVFHHEGENKVAKNPGKFLQTLLKWHSRVLHLDRSNYHGVDKSLRNKVHNSQDSEHSSCLLSDVVPINVFGSRILKLIHQSGKHDVLIMVANSQVVWIDVVAFRALAFQILCQCVYLELYDTLI